MHRFGVGFQRQVGNFRLDEQLNGEPLAWMVQELDRMIGQRIDGERPMIIEGTYLLDVLEQIEWQPDFLVYVCGQGNIPYTDYVARHNPEARADFCLDGLDEDFRGISRSASCASEELQEVPNYPEITAWEK